MAARKGVDISRLHTLPSPEVLEFLCLQSPSFSRAKVPPTKRSEKGDADENASNPDFTRSTNEAAKEGLARSLETRNSLTGLSSYRLSRTTNLRSRPEISNPYAFGSAMYLLDKRYHFVPKPGTELFVPVLC